MRVVLIPGFTQTAASWDSVRAALPSGIEARALGVPLGLDFESTAAALGAAGGRGVYVGYSMGGRLALRLAVDRPDLVAGLVLVSASPGLADATERQARRAADDALAGEIEQIGVDAFLVRWLAQPLFAGVAPDAPGLAERRSFTAADLAASLHNLGTGVQEPLWERLSGLTMPVMLVTGTRDQKFDGIARAMAPLIPGCETVRIAGGHALHLEAPPDLATAIAAFVQGLDDSGDQGRR
ncbi:MAG: alpha/beta fold hydrolase [Acidimicrobiia bacterium]|nr:alpha/beta fold hydrolase [Acidimicrobiia bacterium]